MVRITSLLYRVPVIKFRKGGGGGGGGGVAPGSCKVASAPAAASGAGQQASMSTGAINDFELPLRYQRQPLSQEEIDHINGGGIV